MVKIKRKGVFDYDYSQSGDWHKNFSMLIVAKALEAYFVNAQEVEHYLKLMAKNDIHSFFKRTKFNKLTKLVQREYDKDENLIHQSTLQNITRYYVSNNGKEFVKIMKPLKDKIEDREFAVESGFLCTEINSITKEKLQLMISNINIDYYVNKVQEIIDTIEDYIPIEDLSFDIID